MWPNSTGETNQERKDFLWLPVLQWDSVHLLQLISFMDQAFKMLDIHTDICTTSSSLCTMTMSLHPHVKVQESTEWTQIRFIISLPLLSAAPPLMILATTIAPVDLSFLIVAPLKTVIGEKKRKKDDAQRQRGQAWTVKTTRWFDYSADKLLHSTEGYLYQDGTI